MIDTHAHIHMDPLSAKSPEDILLRAGQAGVNRIINVGADLAGSKRSVELAQKFPGKIYASVGIHPHDAEKANLVGLEALISEPGVVAVGECGLDYYRNLSPKDIQQQVFEAQIELAVKYQKPLIIHNRESDQDVLDRLKDIDYPNVVFHCYSGSIEYTKQLLELGFYFSFTGNITFPKNRRGCEAVKYIPLDRLMIETDCPFMAPVPYRGQTNEPAYVVEVAKKIAELKNLDYSEIISQLDKNAESFFKLA